MPNLAVNVKRARNLIAADDNGFSDPYVVLRIGPKGQKQKTKVIKKNLNPTWNQVLNFKFTEDPNVTDLYVELFDQDFLSDDPLGKVVIPLSDLTKGSPKSLWYTLQSVPRGEVELELTAIDFSTPPRKQVAPPPPVASAQKQEGKRAIESPSVLRDISTFFKKESNSSSIFKKISQFVNDKKKIKQKPIPSLTATAGLDACIQACTKEVRRIVEECRENGTKFFDPVWDPRNNQYGILLGNCSPTEGSFFSPEKVVQVLDGWYRLADLSKNPQLFIDGVDPGDIEQGMIGDCYFLSALSIVAVLPHGLDQLFVDYDIDVGVYGIRFFIDGDWRYVIVDDLVPLDKKGSMMFAQARGGEMWVPLIEKAYAKLFGSFAAIGDGGLTRNSLEDLTGGLCEAWLPSRTPKEQIWQLLLHENQSSSKLFGCGFKAGEEQVGRCGEKGGNYGLVGGHAYGILKAVEIQGQKLIQCRNPWATGEWTGSWSDNSAEWKNFPQIKEALKQKDEDDGAFWMHLDDFYENLSRIEDVTIFSSKWKLAQFDIPGYEPDLKTYFAFSVPKGTHDIAICISQPTNGPSDVVYDVAVGFQIIKSKIDSEGDFLMNGDEPVIIDMPPTILRSAVITASFKEGHYILIPLVSGEIDLHLRLFSKNADVPVFDVDFSGGGSRGREEGETLRQALFLLANNVNPKSLTEEFRKGLEEWTEQVNLSMFPAGIAEELVNLEQGVIFPKKTSFKKKAWEKKCEEALTFGTVAEVMSELERYVPMKSDWASSLKIKFDNIIKREEAKESVRQNVRDALITLESNMGEHSVSDDFLEEREDWISNVQEANTPSEIASQIIYLETCTEWDSSSPSWYNRRAKWSNELQKAKDWGIIALRLMEFERNLGKADISEEWSTLREDWIDSLSAEVKKLSLKNAILKMESFCLLAALKPDFQQFQPEFDSAVMRSLKPSHMAKQLLLFEDHTIQDGFFDDKWNREAWRNQAASVKTWAALAKLLIDFENHFYGFAEIWKTVRQSWIYLPAQWLEPTEAERGLVEEEQEDDEGAEQEQEDEEGAEEEQEEGEEVDEVYEGEEE